MSSPLWVSVAVLAVPGAGAPEGGVSLRTFSSGAGAAGGAAVPVAVAAAGAAVFEAPGAALAPPVVAPPVVAEAVSPFACLSAVVWLSAVAGAAGVPVPWALATAGPASRDTAAARVGTTRETRFTRTSEVRVQGRVAPVTAPGRGGPGTRR